MLNFGNKEFRNLEEQVRKNQTDINGLKSGVVIYKKVDYNDLASYCSDAYLGKYFVAEYQDQNHLFTITRSGAYDNLSVVDLGVWPAAGPQGATGLTGQKGEKGDSIIGPRGYKGDQGAPGRGVDSLSGIDTLSYEATISDPDANGIVEVDTSADVDFGGEDPTVIDFKFKYKVPTDFYGKSTVDSKDAAVLAAAKSYTDAVEANITPHIGVNKNWYIGDYDTGVLAEGAIVESVVKTGTVGLVDTYTMTFNNGDTATFNVTNGADGSEGPEGPEGPQGPQGTTGYSIYYCNYTTTPYTTSVEYQTIFSYWGTTPKCKPGDLILSDSGDVFTINTVPSEPVATSPVSVTYVCNLKGAQGEAGAGANPNILDNSDFRINQRGTNIRTYVSGVSNDSAMCVDRWQIGVQGTANTAGFNFDSTTKEVSLSCEIVDTDGFYACFKQALEDPYKYAGQKLTFSAYADNISYPWLIQVWYKDTDISTTSLGATTYNTDSGKKTITVTIPGTITTAGEVAVIIQTRGSFTVRWAKLEVGETATPYTHPNPSEELLKCQRFYYTPAYDKVYSGDGAVAPILGLGYASATNACWAMFTTPVVMRGTPVLAITKSRTRFRSQATQLSYTPTALYVKNKYGNIIHIFMSMGTNPFTIGEAVTFEMQSNTYAIASNCALYSDIYFN